MTGYKSKKASAQDKLTQWLEALHHSQEPESVDAQPVGQAPCVRHCESTAYEIVIRGLKGDIERMKAAQRTWVSLTDDQIKEIVGPWGDTPIKGYTRKLIDQIDAKLRENNNG